MQKIEIALIGDYNENVVAHIAIPQALDIAAKKANCEVEPQWIATDYLHDNASPSLLRFQGIWCVPASPYKNKSGAISAIRYARENSVPFLGTCGGYQHAILEFARNVLGRQDADSLEDNPDTSLPLVAPMTCSMLECDGGVELLADSRIASSYGTTRITEKYNCSYGFNGEYLPLFNDSALRICAYDADGNPRAIEIREHPFFIGVAFQPERSALASISHPLVSAFVTAALRYVG